MLPFLLAALVGLLVCASCTQLQTTAQAGYTSMAISGDIALAPGAGGPTIHQDVDSALGLGDAVGSPYARVQFDFGVPVLTASAFTFEEQGRGTLNAQFGNITAGTAVASDLRFTNVKASLAFDVIPLGVVKIAPGLAVDGFDLRMHVQDLAATVTEDLTVQAPLPMGFVRAEADLGLVGAVGEFGYSRLPKIEDAKGTFWDAELLVELHTGSSLHLFAGYRAIGLDAEGTTDGQDFAADLRVTGWTIGGGFRF